MAKKPADSVPATDSVAAISVRLRNIRLAYGRVQGYEREISQSEFSRLCKMSVSAWNNAETGDNRLGLDAAVGVCQRTGVSLDYIFRGREDGVPRALAAEIEKLEAAKETKRA